MNMNKRHIFFKHALVFTILKSALKQDALRSLGATKSIWGESCPEVCEVNKGKKPIKDEKEIRIKYRRQVAAATQLLTVLSSWCLTPTPC